jgi:hypothetical protein
MECAAEPLSGREHHYLPCEPQNDIGKLVVFDAVEEVEESGSEFHDALEEPLQVNDGSLFEAMPPEETLASSLDNQVSDEIGHMERNTAARVRSQSLGDDQVPSIRVESHKQDSGCLGLSEKSGSECDSSSTSLISSSDSTSNSDGLQDPIDEEDAAQRRHDSHGDIDPTVIDDSNSGTFVRYH